MPKGCPSIHGSRARTGRNWGLRAHAWRPPRTARAWSWTTSSKGTAPWARSRRGVRGRPPRRIARPARRAFAAWSHGSRCAATGPDAAGVFRPRDHRPERRCRHGGIPGRRGRVDARRVPHHAVPAPVVCRRTRPPARAQRLPRRRCGAGDVQRAHVRRAGDGSARRDAARAAGGVLAAAPRHAARGAAAVAHVGGRRSVVQADAPRGVGARRRASRGRRWIRDSCPVLPVRPRRQCRDARARPAAQPARPAVARGADGARPASRVRGS